MSFTHRVAVITGASAGIGAAIATHLANQGCDLILIARRLEKLAEIKSTLTDAGVKVLTLAGDVTDAEFVKSSFTLIQQTFPTIHYLVNNAGYSSSAAIDELTLAQFQQELQVTLTGTHLCTMAAYPLMSAGGAIVNLSSIRGRMGSPTSSPGYAAAKAGVVAMTKTFAYQLAPHQIRVNAVAPGAIFPTEMTNHWNKDKQQRIAADTVLKRLGKPEEIAQAVSFLLSDQASFITGHTLDVNGGNFMN